MMKLPNLLATATLGLTLFAAACGGTDAPAREATASPTGGAAASPAADVPLTGNVIEVQMISGRGEIFEPAEFTAQRGDIVRFVLVAGVHNVSFPAASNPGAATLPAASPYLQAPGQTHDLVVDLPPGEYRFQCDPHAALGMVGVMTVTD